VFGTPAASLTLRTKYFGVSNPRSSIGLAALNRQVWLLQRVVLHPTYRGAGIASAFVRRACELCPIDWIETLSAMGHANPFFERAGFVKVGQIDHVGERNGAYGGDYPQLSTTTRRNHFSTPIYYILDNRRNHTQLASL
jgi:GNAT superfamily N-acetyltransferase